MIEHTSLLYHESTPYSPVHQYPHQLVKQEAGSFYTANSYHWDENVYNFSTSTYSQVNSYSHGSLGHNLAHESREHIGSHHSHHRSIDDSIILPGSSSFATLNTDGQMEMESGLGEVSCDETTCSSYSCSSGQSSMDEVSNVKGMASPLSGGGGSSLCNSAVNQVTHVTQQQQQASQQQSQMAPCDLVMGMASVKGSLVGGVLGISGVAVGTILAEDGPPGTKVASRLTQVTMNNSVNGQMVNGHCQVVVGASKSKRNKSPGLPDSCAKCGSHFDDDRLLVRHMKVDHYYMETLHFTEPDPGDRQKRYDEWFKKQMNRASLPKELNGQYFKPFKCDICSRHYSYKGTLAGHRIKRHNLATFIDGQLVEPSAAPSDQYLGSFICDSCGFTAGSRKLFERHVLRKHFHGMQPYPCDQCSESFDRSDRLLWHRRQKHAKQALFTCHECGRSYRTKLVFERHQRLQHSGHQFKCKECPKVFKSYASFDYHRRKHMGVEGMKFICEFCGFRFWSNQNRRKHIAKCHADHQVDSAALEENAKKDWSKEASVSVNRSSGKKASRSPVVNSVATTITNAPVNVTTGGDLTAAATTPAAVTSTASASPSKDKGATDAAQSYASNNSRSVPATASANGCVGQVNDFNGRTGVSMDNKGSCRVRDDKLHHFSRSAHDSGVGCEYTTTTATTTTTTRTEEHSVGHRTSEILSGSLCNSASSISMPGRPCKTPSTGSGSSTSKATSTTSGASTSTGTSTCTTSETTSKSTSSSINGTGGGNNDASPRDEASATSASALVHLGTSDGRELSLAACKMTHEYTRSPLAASPSPSSSCPASPCHYNMLHPANSPMVPLNGGERRDACFITHPKAEMRQAAHSHQSASCSSCNLPPHQLPCNHQASTGPVVVEMIHNPNHLNNHHHHHHQQHSPIHNNHNHNHHHQNQNHPNLSHSQQPQPHQHQPHLGHHLHTSHGGGLHHHQSNHQAHICGDHGNNNNNNNNNNNSTNSTQGPDNLNEILSSTSAAPSPPSAPPSSLPPRCRMCFEFVYDLRVHLMNQHKVAFEALEYFLDL